jgi:hypothetical protein
MEIWILDAPALNTSLPLRKLPERGFDFGSDAARRCMSHLHISITEPIYPLPRP